MKDNTYYMGYEDFDYEHHFPIGFFEDLEKLKEELKKKYSDLRYIEIYKVKMNEIFDFYDLEELKDVWKK